MRKYTSSSVFALVFFLQIMACSFAQAPKKLPDNGGVRLPYIIEGEDTIPVVNLKQVSIEEINPDYLKELQAYYRLRHNVIKVYPYARLASVKLQEMQRNMASMKTEREKRKYRKSTEEQIRKDFEEQIKKLSISQGKVLIKLIDRETGFTSYDLIKDLKGSLNAFFSQGIAKLFGHDLKNEYDPEGEDKTIENIVRQIETGQIRF
ncbi:MAG: DUF4294 domain-containing protein [Bacteroidetes bacterium]|nr:MAG: DUF4294 domain-containing protein [Bacteroidota bacterium]REJ99798.1 MAG: DUF4294 domain-containing protein [Bacteroidota bacterium]REK34171.1 MAG: DUF4294 domain-containing protein [Bacteroidota bacterium]REK50501.1 MAG: DUF4294 domain-containing protein [Bacteroidota bacterium]